MGVSKHRGTPKWMVYNGKPYWNGWLGGYHYFRKHPYLLGGGNSHIFVFSPRSLGKCSNLTIIFFKWDETTNQSNIFYMSKHYTSCHMHTNTKPRVSCSPETTVRQQFTCSKKSMCFLHIRHSIDLILHVWGWVFGHHHWTPSSNLHAISFRWQGAIYKLCGLWSPDWYLENKMCWRHDAVWSHSANGDLVWICKMLHAKHMYDCARYFSLASLSVA